MKKLLALTFVTAVVIMGMCRAAVAPPPMDYAAINKELDFLESDAAVRQEAERVGAERARARAAEHPPAGTPLFSFAAQYQTSVILLVPAETTTHADLRKLVLALRTARAQGTLSAFFPPTVRRKGPHGETLGSYSVAEVIVVRDPAWATTSDLRSFINDTGNNNEFRERILAYYWSDAIHNQEEGTVGYKEDDFQQLGIGAHGGPIVQYEKLF